MEVHDRTIVKAYEYLFLPIVFIHIYIYTYIYIMFKELRIAGYSYAVSSP